MVGTYVNVACIIIGSLVGSIFHKAMGERQQASMYTALGLAALLLGVNTTIQAMPDSRYPVLFIIALTIGSLIGASLKLDSRFKHLIDRFSKHGGDPSDKPNLSEGLSTAIFLFCIGALSILGPMEAALSQNYTLLFTNATLDLVTSMALASTYGIGIAWAAPVLLCWQGSLYISAKALHNVLAPALQTEIMIVGGILIVAAALGILNLKDCKPLNLLPALLVPPIWFAIAPLIGM